MSLEQEIHTTSQIANLPPIVKMLPDCDNNKKTNAKRKYFSRLKYFLCFGCACCNYCDENCNGNCEDISDVMTITDDAFDVSKYAHDKNTKCSDDDYNNNNNNNNNNNSQHNIKFCEKDICNKQPIPKIQVTSINDTIRKSYDLEQYNYEENVKNRLEICKTQGDCIDNDNKNNSTDSDMHDSEIQSTSEDNIMRELFRTHKSSPAILENVNDKNEITQSPLRHITMDDITMSQIRNSPRRMSNITNMSHLSTEELLASIHNESQTITTTESNDSDNASDDTLPDISDNILGDISHIIVNDRVINNYSNYDDDKELMAMELEIENMINSTINKTNIHSN